MKKRFHIPTCLSKFDDDDDVDEQVDDGRSSAADDDVHSTMEMQSGVVQGNLICLSKLDDDDDVGDDVLVDDDVQVDDDDVQERVQVGRVVLIEAI